MSYEVISSLQNLKIKNLLRLSEKASERKAQKAFIVEGYKEIELALKGNIPIGQVFFCPELITEPKIQELFEKVVAAKQIFAISKQIFDKVAYRENSFGVILLAQMRHFQFTDLQLRPNPLLLVLENVEKPGNLGAILRTADAANVDAVILCQSQTDIFNPNVIRSSLGCVFTKPIVQCTNTEALHFLKNQEVQILATALTASLPYTEISYRRATAIVMGTEATGLTDFWLQNASQNIIIPMQGEIDSMNVSVTAAIITFEAIRQRNLSV
ncbi:MAG: RNA methyltransferase [Thermonemataceae bacterium]|nr:RNA methyltransferase [Thermonemataceae bacterium]